ncbi:MAG: glycosyltransferase family 2 protein [Bacteroidetes bacterium]|nr:glycosyltransferase family 2 protein [Bacteroidota bacterium]
MIPFTVKKYLEKYALTSWKIEAAELNQITSVIVVPAISEFKNIKKLLDSLSINDNKYFPSTLILFVINNSSSSPIEVKEDNNKSLDLLSRIIKRFDQTKDEVTGKIIASGLRIGLVDAASPGYELPEKDAGVGLARKIGMDLALTIFDYKSEKKKILVCLDADCTVKHNYLTEIIDNFNSNKISAAVVGYSHFTNCTDENAEAIVCYEIFLRYYDLGLLFANSPFAFPTIGSTMVCDYEGYVNVEGMNKRKAAEDFYFLEKLAKNYSIEKIRSTTVYPSSRGSWRVPFGTGQRVNRFLSKKQNEYLLYDPKTFMILKEWMGVFMSDSILTEDLLLASAKEIDLRLNEFLVQQKFQEDWKKILANSKTIEQINRQKKNWFDGFRTLKLIHYLRDTDYPLMNMFDAIDKLFEMMETSSSYDLTKLYVKRKDHSIPAIDIQMEYLTLLRNYF